MRERKFVTNDTCLWYLYLRSKWIFYMEKRKKRKKKKRKRVVKKKKKEHLQSINHGIYCREVTSFDRRYLKFQFIDRSRWLRYTSKNRYKKYIIVCISPYRYIYACIYIYFFFSRLFSRYLYKIKETNKKKER